MNIASKLNSLRTKLRQKGLTLIELVVVMAILIVLAAIILGNFPDLLKRATTATSASNLSDLTRIIQIEYSLNQKLPSGYDSLHQNANTLFIKYTNSVGTVLSSQAASTAEITALNNAGITNIYNHQTAVADATFGSTVGAAPVTVAVAQQLALVSPTALATVGINAGPGLQYTNVYAFGLGSRLSIVGPGNRLQDSPLYTVQNVKPTESYSRPVALISFSADGAKFLGAFGIDNGVLRSLTTRVQDYNSATP